MYIAGIKYILGLTIENGYMSFKPNVAVSWKEYSIKYRYNNSIFNIKVINESGEGKGTKKVILNGQVIENQRIKLHDCVGINEIEVII